MLRSQRKRLFLVLLMGLGFGMGGVTPALASGKVGKWCCMVDGKPTAAPGASGKKMCVRSEQAPSETSKAKNAKKHVADCETAGGMWEKQAGDAKQKQKPAKPAPGAKPAKGAGPALDDM